MQLKAITVLITWRDRNDDCITAGHAGLADDGQFVKLIEFLRVKRSWGCITRIANASNQRAADTLGAAIHSHNFLGRTIELQEPLAYLTILDTMPDVVGGKTAVTFIDERTFKALLLLRTPKSSQPILGFIGMGG